MNLQSSLPHSRSSRLWCVLVFSLLLAGFLVFYLRVPATYSSEGIRFTLQGTGTPGTLTFLVHDLHQRPLAGVPVTSASQSGTTGSVVTNAAGVVHIRPSESEVLAVFIQGRGFRLRRWGVPEHFAPTCEKGLTFQVAIEGDQDRP